MEFKQIFNQYYNQEWDRFDHISNKLQNIVNYQFKNLEYLYAALSIRGSKLPKEEFERLEFLGDSLLKAIQGVLLFEKCQDSDPGELTRLRMNMENNKSLAKFATELPFNELSIMLGIGQLSENQAADCFEALIGALFLDNEKNFDSLLKIIKAITHFEKNFKMILQKSWGGKDPKSFLNEWAQEKYGQDFKIEFKVENRGKSNAPQFFGKAMILRNSTAKIEYEGNEIGPCNTKKECEKEAAQNILTKIQGADTLDK